MDPIQSLPNANITQGSPLAAEFLALNIMTFHAACHWTKALAYGSNSTNDDSRIIFQERCGTCTTKHGAIAHLAAELHLPVQKNLGFYRLNDEIVTGVNAIIEPAGLTFIPQTHCFLSSGSLRVDLTEGNCNGKNKTIADYDFVIPVKPDLTLAEEERLYLEQLEIYFDQYLQLKTLGADRILELLEQCNRQVKHQCSLMAMAIHS